MTRNTVVRNAETNMNDCAQIFLTKSALGLHWLLHSIFCASALLFISASFLGGHNGADNMEVSSLVLAGSVSMESNLYAMQ